MDVRTDGRCTLLDHRGHKMEIYPYTLSESGISRPSVGVSNCMYMYMSLFVFGLAAL